MTSLKTISYTALTAVCLLPAVAGAQEESFALEDIEEKAAPVYTSEVELGAGYTTEDAFKFGEYSGLEEQGGYAIGNLQISKRAAYDGSSTEQWQLIGTNLGLDSRSAYGEYGRQGQYSVYFEYDQIPHFRLDDAKTPYLGAGTTDQTLPGGFISTNDDTTGMTNLSGLLRSVEIDTERQRYGGGFKWMPLKMWELRGSYRHEVKDGAETLGSIFGSNGGNPRSVILAIPVEYNFDEFETSLGFTSKLLQLQLSYHLSLFSNDAAAYLWDNPFNAVSNWCATCPGGVSPNAFASGGRGRMGLDPDNEAHQITFSGGYNINNHTRLTANLSYGWMKQNETFLPYSTFDPILATVEPLPRTSLNGEIDTLLVNIGISSRPLRNLDLRARFTYDDRANQTPRNVYLIVHNDVTAQSTAADSTDRRLNRPYSLERLGMKLDAGYRLGMGSKMTASYAYQRNQRDFSEVKTTDEHTGKVKFSMNPFTLASGWVQYSHAIRNGSGYISNQQLLDGHDPAVITALANTAPDDLFENDPLLRKHYMADRKRDQLSATVNFYPHEMAVISMSGRYNSDDYEKSQVGLMESKNSSATLDVTFTPADNFTGYAFVTYENYDNKQRGFSHPGFLGALTPDTDRIAVFGDAWWTIDSEDNVYTFGTGLDWSVIKDIFKVNLDLLHSRSTTEVDPQSNLALLPFPKLTTRISSVNLSGEYRFKENMGVRLRYQYERFKAADFALDMVTPDILSNVILMGNSSPEYSVHNFGLSYFYNF